MVDDNNLNTPLLTSITKILLIVGFVLLIAYEFWALVFTYIKL